MKDNNKQYYIRQIAMENIDHTNCEQEQAPQKIRTPAALFSKNYQRSPTEQVRLHQSPSSSHLQSSTQNFCQNHPQKKATFSTFTTDQQLFFCQKCAITLASKGHTITKLRPQGSRVLNSPAIADSRMKSVTRQKKHSRQVQIQAFMSSLSLLRKTICNTRQTIMQKLIESQQFYGSQMQQINDYFSLIIKSLELQKNKCYNHILKERQQAQQNIRNINNQLVEIDQEATRILLDIEDNLDTVYSIDENMYQLVLSQHLAQQSQFHQVVNQLLLTPIQMKKIDFQGVPDSLYNISDLVIQNSINNNHQSQEYRLVDSLNAEELNNILAVSPRQEVRDTTPYRQLSETDSLKFSFEAEKLRAVDRKQLNLSSKSIIKR